jgi:hypothetical protein
MCFFLGRQGGSWEYCDSDAVESQMGACIFLWKEKPYRRAPLPCRTPFFDNCILRAALWAIFDGFPAFFGVFVG